ncbi:MAG: hypothetical protein O7D91_00095 [Planctomycetota bacterium]|nr:hypothetical protein [Planctomycetota bacterium]
MAKKAGRPANHWTDSVTGEVVNGLARRPRQGRFYAIGHNKTFGTDEQIAIRRYHAWKHQDKSPGLVAFEIRPSRPPRELPAGTLNPNIYDVYPEIPVYDAMPVHLRPLIQGWDLFRDTFLAFLRESGLEGDFCNAFDKRHRGDDCEYERIEHCECAMCGNDGGFDTDPETVRVVHKMYWVIREGYKRFWAEYLDWVIGRWIKANPADAARRLDYPELANLSASTPRPPSIPLAKIADLYESKASGGKSYNARFARLFRRFAKIIGVRTVREIESDHIVKYEKRILDAFYKDVRGDDWLNERFHGVRRVLRYARKRGADRDEITRVIGLCEMLEIPKSAESAERTPEPNPIEREHLHAVLGLADEKQKAVILLGLNCLYIPIDFARITEEAIDFKAGTVYFPRVKPRKKIPRVAVLWKRTLKALQDYRDLYPHDARDAKGRKVLMVTQHLKPLTENSRKWISGWWGELRDRAGLPAAVTFKTLRSGGYTEAYQVSSDQADVLAGHALRGKTDHYLKRNPRFVAPACAAIEKHYFG